MPTISFTRFLSIFLVTFASLTMTTVHAQLTPALVQAFAPTGSLRASINLGNPILANRDANGQPVGVSVDLATELAKRLGVPLSLVVFDAAGKSVDAVTNEKADFGFFAIDPVRGQGISFTGPYVLIEGSYLVANNSPLTSNDQVDKKGIRIAVGKGSAYDLFLTRHLKNATIIRAESSQAVIPDFLAQHIEIAAGVKQQLEADTKGVTGLRMLPERFMVINQAMGVPKTKGPAAAVYLRHFVEEMKAKGFVKDSMTRHGIQGAGVGLPADPNKDPLDGVN